MSSAIVVSVGLGVLLAAQPAAAAVVELRAGELHTCALSDSGRVSCWGAGAGGRLGYGNQNDVGDDEVPEAVGTVHLGGEAAHVATGAAHSCAVLRTGEVRCWGMGLRGRLGYGNQNDIGDDEAPASAGSVEVGAKVLGLALGSFHSCALLEGGHVRCWGARQMLGEPGATDVGDDESPAAHAVVELGGRATQIAAGRSHTCALLDTGSVRCWGGGGQGRLGYGSNTNIGDDETPASVGNVQVGGRVLQIAAGAMHTCALLEGGRVRCWGAGARGPLGYGNPSDVGNRGLPEAAGDVPVGAAAEQLTAGGYDGRNHTCAVLSDGSARCWGAGAHGQLGYGTTVDVGDDETPATVGGINFGVRVSQLAAGGNHTCAILTGGSVRCWGSASNGQLGYASRQSVGDAQPSTSMGPVQIEGAQLGAQRIGGGLVATGVAALTAFGVSAFFLYRKRRSAATA